MVYFCLFIVHLLQYFTVEWKKEKDGGKEGESNRDKLIVGESACKKHTDA